MFQSLVGQIPQPSVYSCVYLPQGDSWPQRTDVCQPSAEGSGAVHLHSTRKGKASSSMTVNIS